MPEREPFSGADNAWRRMGETNNLMTITGILFFEERITYEELRDRLESRLLRFDRFKQKVGGRKRRFQRPYWELVEDFDIDNHILEVELPEPKDEAAFEEFIGKLMSRPLDERRPLWEIYLMQDAGPPEGNAMAIRINHSLGDGFALLYVLLGLVDNPMDIEFPVGGVSAPPVPEEELAESGATSEADPTEANGGTAAVDETEDRTASTGSEPGGEGSSSGSNRPDPADVGGGGSALDTLGMAANGVKTAYDLFTMRDEPKTSLSGDLSPTKRAGWTRPIDLDRVKKIGTAHDATVNDVLLAATAGAVRRVLEGRGEATDGLELRFTIPVNLKPMEDRTESLGNYFGLLWAPVPVGTRDLNERIEIIHERMDARKAGMEAFIMYQLLNVGGIVPETLQGVVMDIFKNSATGIVTNVPGPMDTVKLAGKEVSDLIFWVPQGNDQGLGVSIISYDGAVRIGVAGDANMVPDPGELTDAFEDEIDALFSELDPDET